MNRVPKLIKFPKELVQLVEDYRKQHKIRTFSGAVYDLLKKGLQGANDNDNAR
ncbi:hypothetical protein CAY60_015075 [Shouchella clausii]|jgi:hypothetical protein|uniref:Arc family DNA-binding protein n=1 Tax=Shouchella rhizosphaerae TaxID=866786 RepID=A0ABZ2D2L5_9BACI|nr:MULTISPECIES: hypothetical protein [Shouchella]MCM3311345.1 hypothetical protein [Psychrobacillus sp. MER TA 17]ALA52999.1 hypothetical protein DB29_02171 [Shouchella clausii]MBU3231441.1 hypothetical protein [Shouchella clausii]MBU3263556.1 hypothetical protein [Shouchella clausii]MBU3507947.1 hypothetical protein [Shouchella clausii]